MVGKVFALDIFAEIKKHGLLNPEIGQKIRQGNFEQAARKTRMNCFIISWAELPTRKRFLKTWDYKKPIRYTPLLIAGISARIIIRD